MFKVCARTVLELGAELISSDIIAFYELIKNSLDAKSPNGAEIYFDIALRKNDYLKIRQRAVSEDTNLDQLKLDTENALDISAPKELLDKFHIALYQSDDAESFVEALDEAYAAGNRVVVADTGTGMSSSDLLDNYLVIGTTSRKKAIDKALNSGDKKISAPPYLGEKGVGRLSVMRLGERLSVETAQKKDKHINLLNIDWSDFDNVNAMLDEINIQPERGDTKPEPEWSGTKLIISQLNSDWTINSVRHLCSEEFSRLTDPFSDAKRRPRIAVFWNGERISVAHMDSNLLEHAHASAKGKFHYNAKKNEPTLTCSFEAMDLGFEHPHEKYDMVFRRQELEGLIVGTSEDIPFSALENLGEFEFEAYWFNRRRLGAIDSVGDRNDVVRLQKRWSGILLFRDGFRVLPYGNEEDDWLGMDRKALGSSGYLLNKSQFVGRVKVSRLENRQIIDQTNREGLRACPEQKAFVMLLQLGIQERLRHFLQDFQKRHKNQPIIDMKESAIRVPHLEKKARNALKKIRQVAPDTAAIVEEAEHVFFEIKELFDDTQRRISEVEDEKHQVMQMAAVGLLVEVVAHELARSSENALRVLVSLGREKVPDQIGGLLNALRSEMKAVSKRLRILDPLSVSGRQRKEPFRLDTLVSDILDGHEAQFKRHQIQSELKIPEQATRIRAVKGMVVQIIENLVSNSVYWLDLRLHREPDFKPSITIEISTNPLVISYEDNGCGISKEYHEEVFKEFFSLKEKKTRRGLGLYIARDCAKHHGGTLILDETPNDETGRLHRFILTLPDKVIVS